MAKVLLVEDDNNLREIYQARLMAEGYDIVSAMNGEEALVVAKQEQPDLVISDVMMPRISGFEMLDIMRNTTGLKDFKVIMLTALGQSEDKQRADSLGADRYLVKSQVTLEDIVNAAHELLDGSATPVTEATAQPVADVTAEPAATAATMPAPVAATPATETSPTVVPVAQPEPVAPVAAPQVMPVENSASTQEPVAQPAPVAQLAAPVSVTVPAPQTTVSTPPEPVMSTVIPEPIQVPDPTAASQQSVAAQPATQPVTIAEPATTLPEPTSVPVTHQTAPEPTPAVPVAPEALTAAQSAAVENSTIQEQINDFVAQPVADTEVEATPEQPAQGTTVPDGTAQPITVVTAAPVEVVAAPATDTESSVVSSNDITPLDAPELPEATPQENNIPAIETAQDVVMTKALQDLGGAPDNVPQIVSTPTPDKATEISSQPAPTVFAPSAPTSSPDVAASTNQPDVAPVAPQIQDDTPEDDDSVTVAHKKVIRPISGQETASLGLDELMAKEGLDLSGPTQASVGGQTAPQANPQVGVPQPPGKVVGPTSGVDPSSIAL